MPKFSVSPPVIKRLPRYYRFLDELERQSIIRISSGELSKKIGFTASQIRQDLNCFGGFGQQGYGYNVSELKKSIGEILGINEGNKTILIGAGNLGKAVTLHIDFPRIGFKLVGIFDNDPNITDKIISGLAVKNIDKLEDFCKVHNPVCAVLCIPETAAEELVPRLIGSGVKAFWNFSHYDFNGIENVIVENVHLADSLMTIAYGLNNSEE